MIDVAVWLTTMNMTPRQLADELGLSRATVSGLISGQEEPGSLVEWALLGLASKRHKAPSDSIQNVAPVGPLASSLADERWAGETARLAMPILIDIAKAGKIMQITYGDLHTQVIARGGKSDVGTLAKYAHPCGRIARAAEEASDLIGDDVPPLTAIVVNGTTGLPSAGIDGFLRNYLGRSETSGWAKSPSKRRAAIETIWNDIFNYTRWDEVQSAVGLTGNSAYDR
jgi:hypothetical protein